MTTKWLIALLLALGAGLAIAVAWHDRDMAVDDAYITFRYADNLLAGHGLRWNPDSPPCEGYTNLSYVVGIALLRACGLPPTHAALGIAAFRIVVLVWLLWRAAAPAGRWAPAAAVPAVLLLGASELTVHASRGLETVAFAALAAAQLTALARLLASPLPRRRHAVATAAIACLLFLTRPDGVLMSAAGFAATAWLVRRDAPRRRTLALAIGLWLLGGAVYAAAKLAWFGYLLPNPFYMKAAVQGFAGIPEITAFVTSHWLLLLLALAAVAGPLLVARVSPTAADERASLLALAIAIPWLGYGAKIVHEIGFAHRFAWPLLPVLALATTRTLAAMAAPFTATSPRLLPLLAWGALAAVLWLRGAQFEQQWRHLGEPRPHDPITAAFLRFGDAIRDSGLGPQLTLFCANAGATPYAAGVHHVDPAGLVDDGYCLRTPAEERGRYQASQQFDVVAWNLFPASPGAATFDDDARARESEYLARFWRLDDDLDGAARHGAAHRTVAERKADLFLPMYVLREHATLIGELRIGLPGSRLFVYVWKTSRWHDRLVEHLRQRVEIPPDAIDYAGKQR